MSFKVYPDKAAVLLFDTVTENSTMSPNSRDDMELSEVPPASWLRVVFSSHFCPSAGEILAVADFAMPAFVFIGYTSTSVVNVLSSTFVKLPSLCFTLFASFVAFILLSKPERSLMASKASV